jgi:hypothetical protein
MIFHIPRWLSAVRVLDFTILGITLAVLVMSVARIAYKAVTSVSQDGRTIYALALFGQTLFIIMSIMAIAGVTERIAERAPLSWRDVTVPIIFTLVAVYARVVFQLERKWNPDMRRDQDADR